jgi:16S rRNA processing protein RimM
MDTEIYSPVVVAKIAKPHGLRGEVVLESFTDGNGRLENTRCFLLLDGGKVVRRLQVRSHRFFNGRHVLAFDGFDSRNAAETLRNLELGIPNEELGKLDPERFFVHELIGMSVLLKDGTNIGTIQNVIHTKGGDILEVGDHGEKLIPFAAKICVEVDPEKRRITIDPPEGLLQLNAD